MWTELRMRRFSLRFHCTLIRTYSRLAKLYKLPGKALPRKRTDVFHPQWVLWRRWWPLDWSQHFLSHGWSWKTCTLPLIQHHHYTQKETVSSQERCYRLSIVQPVLSIIKQDSLNTSGTSVGQSRRTIPQRNYCICACMPDHHYPVSYSHPLGSTVLRMASNSGSSSPSSTIDRS